jgi:hypothetical protein
MVFVEALVFPFLFRLSACGSPIRKRREEPNPLKYFGDY